MDLQLQKQIQQELAVWSEMNRKADVIRAKFMPIGGEIQYISDEEFAIVKAADDKWDKIYQLMLMAHP